jgi:hypothetical protein
MPEYVHIAKIFFIVYISIRVSVGQILINKIIFVIIFCLFEILILALLYLIKINNVKLMDENN